MATRSLQVERPLWRSLLYVPVNRTQFVEKAHLRRADAIILDLEDSVPDAELPQARRMLPEAIASAGRGGADVLVRVNNAAGELEADLEAMQSCLPRAIVVPKVTSGSELERVGRWLSDHASAASVALVAIIESAAGLLAASEVASAEPRTVALTLGSEDFAADVGMVAEEDTLLLPKQLALYAARAHGLMALGLLGSIADFRDLDSAARTARRSRRFGFEGASCVHPALVPVLNQAFLPSSAEVKTARRIVEAYDSAVRDGIGSFELDGRMVDLPIVLRARAILARHAAAVAKDAG